MKRSARTARCYTDQALQPEQEVQLDKRSSHHLSTVLRASVGQSVQLFNGDGKNYIGSITSTGKKTTVAIDSVMENNFESSLHITLVQAVVRGDKMDGIIQKSTELGVNAIQPVYTTHAISKLDASRAEKKQAHWQGVVISACEQCGRSQLPTVYPVINLSQYLDSCNKPNTNEIRWILSPTATPSSHQHANIQSISLLVGPESGFDNEEIQAASTAQFIPLKLGPRILRTETAGPASIAILQAQFGDMN